MRAATENDLGDIIQETVFQSTQPMRAATDGRRSGCGIRITFQSTQPMRAATHIGIFPGRWIGNFNPRSPCGLRQIANLEGALNGQFQSTQPMRAATELKKSGEYNLYAISIHAAHAGCDIRFRIACFRLSNFNPRSPCGLRPNVSLSTNWHTIISIHAAHAGCDLFSGAGIQLFLISIHAAHAGCDRAQRAIGRRRRISIHAAHAGCDG